MKAVADSHEPFGFFRFTSCIECVNVVLEFPFETIEMIRSSIGVRGFLSLGSSQPHLKVKGLGSIGRPTAGSEAPIS